MQYMSRKEFLKTGDSHEILPMTRISNDLLDVMSAYRGFLQNNINSEFDGNTIPETSLNSEVESWKKTIERFATENKTKSCNEVIVEDNLTNRSTRKDKPNSFDSSEVIFIDDSPVKKTAGIDVSMSNSGDCVEVINIEESPLKETSNTAVSRSNSVDSLDIFNIEESPIKEGISTEDGLSIGVHFPENIYVSPIKHNKTNDIGISPKNCPFNKNMCNEKVEELTAGHRLFSGIEAYTNCLGNSMYENQPLVEKIGTNLKKSCRFFSYSRRKKTAGIPASTLKQGKDRNVSDNLRNTDNETGSSPPCNPLPFLSDVPICTDNNTNSSFSNAIDECLVNKNTSSDLKNGNHNNTGLSICTKSPPFHESIKPRIRVVPLQQLL